MSEFLGIPVVANPNLRGRNFALIAGDSVATVEDDKITIHVRREMTPEAWRALLDKWTPEDVTPAPWKR